MASISSVEFIEHVGRESSRFLDVLRAVPDTVAVPSCQDWNAGDLLFHLAEVQNFWATVVAERLQTDDEVDSVRSDRPADRDALETAVAQNTVRLVTALRSTPPETALWTWAPDKSTAFVCRRQAHEALIHRVDAELTAGNRTPMNPTLAADGVHEVLDLMHGGPPSWGTFTPNPGQVVRFNAHDSDETWTVAVGRFAGTDPSGQDHDVSCLDWVPDATPPTAEVVATAEDLDCWLWGRAPRGKVTRTGDEATLAALAAKLAEGIQ